MWLNLHFKPRLYDSKATMALAFNAKSICMSPKVLDKIHILRSQTQFSDLVGLSVDQGFFFFFSFNIYTSGEGNGIPFQYSCLENPVDRGAWWAAVQRVTQSRT